MTEQNKKISLSDLKKANIEDMAPATEKPPVQPSTLDAAFAKIDNEVIPRVKEEAEEKMLQNEFNNELNGVSDVEKEVVSDSTTEDLEYEISKDEPTPVVENETKKEIKYEIDNGFDSNSIESLDDSDFEDLEEQIYDDSDESRKERTNEFKNSINEKIVPFKKIDSSKFGISSKPMSLSNALKVTTTEKLTEWVLPGNDCAVVLKPFKGIDIQNLSQDRTVNRINYYRRVYNTFFNKLLNKNKYGSMEQWVKTVKLIDEDHLYFAAYLSAFKDANIIPFECSKCKKVFTQEVPIEDMIVYKNDEIKKKVKNILDSDHAFKERNKEIDIYIEQISDDYAIGIKDPSIYNIYFENSILDEEFAKKYANILSLATYIDSIYKIDYDNQSFVPVPFKTYPEDMVKTVKAKIIQINKILQLLTPDQYSYLVAMISNLNIKENDITYKFPDIKCPHCGEMIPGGQTTAKEMLFTRHQLATIGNSVED